MCIFVVRPAGLSLSDQRRGFLSGTVQKPMNVYPCVSLQCFPEGTDMTAILDFYFQVSGAVISFFLQYWFSSHSFLMTEYSLSALLTPSEFPDQGPYYRNSGINLNP